MQQDSKKKEKKSLHGLFEAYFEDLLKLFPLFGTYIGDHRYDNMMENDISEDHRGKVKAFLKLSLDNISNIKINLLDKDDQISLDIFRKDLMESLEGLQFQDHLLPINQFWSTPALFAQLGSGKSIHPFREVKDYRNFLARMKDFETWIDTAISNMEQGIRKGVLQPSVVIEKTLPQIEALICEDERKSIFYRPVEDFPLHFGEGDKKEITDEYRSAISDLLNPLYRKLNRYLKENYLPRCRDTIGLAELPDGEKWYAHKVRTSTTTEMTFDEIFETGMEEIERIKNDMITISNSVNFNGLLKDFFHYLRTDPRFYPSREEDLLYGYRNIRKRVEPLLPGLFGLLPKSGFEIQPVEEFMAQSDAAARYMGPSGDGSRPGIFYVNTYDLKSRPLYEMESLFLHEAVPGHHLQISLQQEQINLPRFRRFGSYTAYVEGWALYAEGLGKEVGLYEDPYQYFGRLSNEIWRAIRLVVDVGIHAKGWTKEEALRFMTENSAITEPDAVSEIERYIVLPGQALSYKIGELKIKELRKRAKDTLKQNFNIKTFHDELLRDGALPLDVLESKMYQWMKEH